MCLCLHAHAFCTYNYLWQRLAHERIYILLGSYRMYYIQSLGMMKKALLAANKTTTIYGM